MWTQDIVQRHGACLVGVSPGYVTQCHVKTNEFIFFPLVPRSALVLDLSEGNKVMTIRLENQGLGKLTEVRGI